ncbi:MAG TPA: CBS domain-containing protein, partial [Thermoanaerobaculia bacterium]|nr:CBS domain-containing protein [Thermoanaerobaculia bacterium]
MLIKDVMTTKPVCCDPADTLDTVAKLMLEHDCGEIPVCDGAKILGVITDRDITLRVVAAGRTPSAVTVRDVMTNNVVTIRDTDKVDRALELMEEKLVRRLPVVNDDDKLVGIVSEADLVAKMPAMRVARLVRSVS